jgi:soluble lytic murein transglycosylase
MIKRDYKDSKVSRSIKIITAIVIILILTISAIMLQKPIQKQIYPRKYAEYVEKYGDIYNVDVNLIYAIIKAESNFNEKSISSLGAMGLMQLLDSTASEVAQELEMEYSTNMLYNPEFNIQIGVKYFSNLLDSFNGNVPLSLMAYNAGRSTVLNWIEEGIIKEDGSNIEDIPYKETNTYVKRILSSYKAYSELEK